MRGRKFGLKMPRRYGKEAEADTTPEQEQGEDKAAKTFTQEAVDAIVKERLAKEKAKAKQEAEAAAAKARQDAEADALSKNKEFEALAVKRAEQVTALEAEKGALAEQVTALSAQVEAYEAAIKAQLDAQRKDLPEEYADLLDKQAPLEQLAWLAKHRDKLTKQREFVPGSPGKEGRGMTAEQQDKARQRAAGFYRNF